MPRLGTTLVEGSVHGGSGSGAAGRVAVVFERSNAGTAALREAAELANAGRELSVVTLAPQARPPRWGRAGGEGPYNIAVREEAELELQEARDLLGSVANRATFKVLAGCPQPARSVGGPTPVWACPASPPSADPRRQPFCEKPAEANVGGSAAGQVARAAAPDDWLAPQAAGARVTSCQHSRRSLMRLMGSQSVEAVVWSQSHELAASDLRALSSR